MDNKRIVFMGTPEIAEHYLLALIENNFLVEAVYTQPPRKKGRGLKLNKSPIHIFAENFGIPTYDSTNFQLSEIIEKFKNLKPDLVVVMGYGVIIPKLILKIPKYGFINIHVSLLPRWRGAAPIEHAILNGDHKTGISIFQIEEKLDTGPILDFKEVEISKQMIDIMLKAPGVGLAANQIGILKKIITVNILDSKKNLSKTYALFNPKINYFSNEKVIMEEGCLSFPEQFVEIERPSSIEIEYINENNKIIKAQKNGLEARIIQHEIDHLYGKLFIDHISSLKRNMLVKRLNKLKKKENFDG